MSQTLAASSGAQPQPQSRSRAATAPGHPTPRASGRGAARAPRPSLRVVAAPVAEHGRTVFVLACLALLVGGLIMLLLINTALAQGSFRLHDLTSKSRQLADESQALSEDIAGQASPGRLSQRAAGLGMVPSGSVAFLRLADGLVLGVASAATVAPTPTLATATAVPVKPGSVNNPGSAKKPTSTSTKQAARR